jgi:hypothetical protein
MLEVDADGKKGNKKHLIKKNNGIWMISQKPRST